MVVSLLFTRFYIYSCKLHDEKNLLSFANQIEIKYQRENL